MTLTLGQAGEKQKNLREKLQITPISFKEANEFVKNYHRHHKPVPGSKFCLAVSHGGEVVGVAIVGRPVGLLKSTDVALMVQKTPVPSFMQVLGKLQKLWATQN